MGLLKIYIINIHQKYLSGCLVTISEKATAAVAAL